MGRLLDFCACVPWGNSSSLRAVSQDGAISAVAASPDQKTNGTSPGGDLEAQEEECSCGGAGRGSEQPSDEDVLTLVQAAGSDASITGHAAQAALGASHFKPPVHFISAAYHVCSRARVDARRMTLAVAAHSAQIFESSTQQLEQLAPLDSSKHSQKVVLDLMCLVLSSGPSSSAMGDCKACVARLGRTQAAAITAILQVVGKEAAPVWLQLSGLRCLYKLLRRPDSAAAAIKSHAHVLLVRLLDCPTEPLRVRAALVCIYYLGADNTEVQELLAGCGVAPKVVRVCQEAQGLMRQEAVQVIKMLCRSGLCCEALEQAGVRAVLDSILTANHDADTVAQAEIALARLDDHAQDRAGLPSPDLHPTSLSLRVSLAGMEGPLPSTGVSFTTTTSVNGIHTQPTSSSPSSTEPQAPRPLRSCSSAPGAAGAAAPPAAAAVAEMPAASMTAAAAAADAAVVVSAGGNARRSLHGCRTGAAPWTGDAAVAVAAGEQQQLLTGGSYDTAAAAARSPADAARAAAAALALTPLALPRSPAGFAARQLRTSLQRAARTAPQSPSRLRPSNTSTPSSPRHSTSTGSSRFASQPGSHAPCSSKVPACPSPTRGKAQGGKSVRFAEGPACEKGLLSQASADSQLASSGGYIPSSLSSRASLPQPSVDTPTGEAAAAGDTLHAFAVKGNSSMSDAASDACSLDSPHGQVLQGQAGACASPTAAAACAHAAHAAAPMLSGASRRSSLLLMTGTSAAASSCGESDAETGPAEMSEEGLQDLAGFDMEAMAAEHGAGGVTDCPQLPGSSLHSPAAEQQLQRSEAGAAVVVVVVPPASATSGGGGATSISHQHQPCDAGTPQGAPGGELQRANSSSTCATSCAGAATAHTEFSTSSSGLGSSIYYTPGSPRSHGGAVVCTPVPLLMSSGSDATASPLAPTKHCDHHHTPAAEQADVSPSGVACAAGDCVGGEGIGSGLSQAGRRGSGSGGGSSDECDDGMSWLPLPPQPAFRHPAALFSVQVAPVAAAQQLRMAGAAATWSDGPMLGAAERSGPPVVEAVGAGGAQQLSPTGCLHAPMEGLAALTQHLCRTPSLDPAWDTVAQGSVIAAAVAGPGSDQQQQPQQEVMRPHPAAGLLQPTFSSAAAAAVGNSSSGSPAAASRHLAPALSGPVPATSLFKPAGVLPAPADKEAAGLLQGCSSGSPAVARMHSNLNAHSNWVWGLREEVDVAASLALDSPTSSACLLHEPRLPSSVLHAPASRCNSAIQSTSSVPHSSPASAQLPSASSPASCSKGNAQPSASPHMLLRAASGSTCGGATVANSPTQPPASRRRPEPLTACCTERPGLDGSVPQPRGDDLPTPYYGDDQDALVCGTSDGTIVANGSTGRGAVLSVMAEAALVPAITAKPLSGPHRYALSLASTGSAHAPASTSPAGRPAAAAHASSRLLGPAGPRHGSAAQGVPAAPRGLLAGRATVHDVPMRGAGLVSCTSLANSVASRPLPAYMRPTISSRMRACTSAKDALGPSPFTSSAHLIRGGMSATTPAPLGPHLAQLSGSTALRSGCSSLRGRGFGPAPSKQLSTSMFGLPRSAATGAAKWGSVGSSGEQYLKAAVSAANRILTPPHGHGQGTAARAAPVQARKAAPPPRLQQGSAAAQQPHHASASAHAAPGKQLQAPAAVAAPAGAGCAAPSRIPKPGGTQPVLGTQEQRTGSVKERSMHASSTTRAPAAQPEAGLWAKKAAGPASYPLLTAGCSSPQQQLHVAVAPAAARVSGAQLPAAAVAVVHCQGPKPCATNGKQQLRDPCVAGSECGAAAAGWPGRSSAVLAVLPVALPAAGPSSGGALEATDDLLGMAAVELGDFLLSPDDFQLECGEDGATPLLLGEGGFSYVHQGVLHGVDPVAIKVAKKERPSRSELQAFISEVQLLRRLNHRNIVQAYGVCLGGVGGTQRLALVTELMRGGDMWHALRNHPQLMRWEVLGHKIAHDVAVGLNHLHCQNPPLMHRDLKSPNVLLSEEGVAKIADVGMSRPQEADLVSAQPIMTPLWAAPEVVAKQPSSIKCDIWSFGLLVWELATGRDITQYQPLAVSRQMSLSGAKTVQMPADAPVVACMLFEACTRHDPAARPTAAQCVTWLREAATDAPTPAAAQQ